jgi:hypothetical protein
MGMRYIPSSKKGWLKMSGHEHEVTITVNGKPVQVQRPKVTGLEIKQQAINQEVPIALDFILSEEIGERRSRVIGDGEEVTVNKNSKFIAVAPDDNS